jgi:PAS domain S-box-containing protein
LTISAGEKITGYSLEEILGQNGFNLFCSTDECQYIENLYKEVKNGNVIDVEVALTTKNGDKRIILWNFVNRYNEKGEYINIIAFGNDITEKKRSAEEKKKLENQMYQAEKMSALGSLAREIAHDFNNILVAILSYTYIALLDVTQTSVKKNLHEVLSACNRAKELIRHIQTFTHQTEQKNMPVNINLLLKETLSLIRLTLPDTIKLRYNIDEKSKLVMADPSQIYRMLMNFYTNSAHAMKEKGGILEISLMNIDVTPETMGIHKSLAPGEYVCLIIKDTGCGMDFTVMKHIFEPYFTTKKAGNGTGLGLSIVHNIVKNYRGEIKVESVLGEGTTFYVYLPSIAYEAGVKETKKNQKAKGSILLVDDDLDVFQSEKAILEMFGYEVTGQKSSIDALRTFESDPDKFDLVIADHNMPEMNGSKLAQKLLNIKPDIPIILCSGNIEGTKPDINPAGIKQFITKPFDIREIARIIGDIINN